MTPTDRDRITAMARLLTHEGHMTRAGYLQMKDLAREMTQTPQEDE